MEKIRIKVKDDFTEYPGTRFRKHSDNSAEQFYEEHLNPKFQQAKDGGTFLIVDLDGCAGFASSFLDQAFGSLAHKHGLEEVENRMLITSNECPSYIKDIMESMREWHELGPPKR
jgi:hypothetical protein